MAHALFNQCYETVHNNCTVNNSTAHLYGSGHAHASIIIVRRDRTERKRHEGERPSSNRNKLSPRIIDATIIINVQGTRSSAEIHHALERLDSRPQIGQQTTWKQVRRQRRDSICTGGPATIVHPFFTNFVCRRSCNLNRRPGV